MDRLGETHNDSAPAPLSSDTLRDELVILLHIATHELRQWHSYSWQLARLRQTLQSQNIGILRECHNRAQQGKDSKFRGRDLQSTTADRLSPSSPPQHQRRHCEGDDNGLYLDGDLVPFSPGGRRRGRESILSAQTFLLPPGEELIRTTTTAATASSGDPPFPSSSAVAADQASAGFSPPSAIEAADDREADLYYEGGVVGEDIGGIGMRDFGAAAAVGGDGGRAEGHRVRERLPPREGHFIPLLLKLALVLFVLKAGRVTWLIYSALTFLAMSGALNVLINALRPSGQDNRPIDQRLRHMREQRRIAREKRIKEKEEKEQKEKEENPQNVNEDDMNNDVASTEEINALHPSAGGLRHRRTHHHDDVVPSTTPYHGQPQQSSPTSSPSQPTRPAHSEDTRDASADPSSTLASSSHRIPWHSRFAYQLFICFVGSALPWWVPNRLYLNDDEDDVDDDKFD